MPRLAVYNSMSLDGFIADSAGDMSWAHKQDAQWREYVNANAASGGALVFGRKTYQMMTMFWPTPDAMKWNPVVAERMNNLPKVVFSSTLAEATWNNTRLVRSDIVAAITAMKDQPGPNITILGSASIVSQCARAGLIDEYHVVLNPVVLGAGLSMFAGVREHLRLAASRQFENGNVLLTYQ